MKYRLSELVTKRQNVALHRKVGNNVRPVFLRLEPGVFYDEYTDDPVFVQSLKDYKITVAGSAETERLLKEREIPYVRKKACPCVGGFKLTFQGIEVVE